MAGIVLIIRSLDNRGPTPFLVLSSILVVFSAACSVTGSGDTASLIAELDAELPTVVASGNSPSIQVAAVHRGQVVWSRAFGENTSIDHVYMNASVQKVFTAAAVLQLVERGLVDLDTDIGTYVPFSVGHPDFPETPITVRMLLAHRSGLDAFPHQFAWDTESSFSPEYRPPIPAHLAGTSLEEFLIASLTPEGSNYAPQAWVLEPGQGYHYSVSAYPLLRYLVSQVTQQSYADYMYENAFAPLGMNNSGFSAEEFAGRHAVPYTRVSGQNIELPIWDGHGSMMHTTAEDMAKFVLALMNDGRRGRYRRSACVVVLRRATPASAEKVAASKRWGNISDLELGIDLTTESDLPGWSSRRAAEYLATVPIRAYGTDALSVDAMDAANVEAESVTARAIPIHHSFLSRAIPIYEELFNLDRLTDRPESDALYFTGVPLSIQDGDGMLVRPVVLVY